MKKVKISNLTLGNGHIYIQSMTNTKTFDVKGTVDQILALQNAGCEIVRVSVPDIQSAHAISEIKKQISIPLVADIHFDHKLAILAIENGVDKVRINPGNIGGKENISELVKVCKERSIPIRIGVNSGSTPEDIFLQHGNTPKALYESAKRHVQLLEDESFFNTVISIKSTSVAHTIEANRMLKSAFDYPLHIGMTEAGTAQSGMTKSAIAIGSLLFDGIGDTIRVSLSGDPVHEIYAAQDILRALRLEKNFVEVISCPTCARCDINVEEIADKINAKYSHIKKPLKVAIMGCVVNGIGEGKEADIGIAGGKTQSVLFKKGEKIATIDNKNIFNILTKEIDNELKN